ncbi:SRPBCC family protein [Gillisia sp. M10.2A]|uniref:SRPBCC family protein n=1 Tax=Gillisia lutea TaxID=2909668 RepID=A0ABS9EIT8_9FLAO|nr:SRPBCC family protein [Gillisia lutea]MCF4102773.1 SRPBCC family protein [Gillisia lutea]
MTLFFYILIAIITFIAFLHAWAKKEFDISRTVIINRPKEEVFNIVRQLKKEYLWMPWFTEDFNGELKYKGEDGKQDAALYWKGHKRFFEGTQKIVKIHHGKIVETRFLFLKPFRMIFLDYKGMKEIDENTTKMVWGIRGGLKFPFSVLALIQPVDKVYGKELELGLKNLKQLLENKN